MIDAGRYDGPLGVVVGILAVKHLVARKAKLPFAIDVLAFGDEEGSRFRSTLASSSACAGIFDKASLAFPDRNGVTLSQAIESYGKKVSDIPAAAYARDEAAAYVEVHIEQGPVLEAENLPLGVVTAIVGQSRMRVVVLGEAGHAGTVPMHDAARCARGIGGDRAGDRADRQRLRAPTIWSRPSGVSKRRPARAM